MLTKIASLHQIGLVVISFNFFNSLHGISHRFLAGKGGVALTEFACVNKDFRLQNAPVHEVFLSFPSFFLLFFCCFQCNSVDIVVFACYCFLLVCTAGDQQGLVLSLTLPPSQQVGFASFHGCFHSLSSSRALIFRHTLISNLRARTHACSHAHIICLGHRMRATSQPLVDSKTMNVSASRIAMWPAGMFFI